MKAQLLETFECLNQNSPNSCHLWNNKYIFLKIWHHSSVPWDIILCTVLAEILYTFNKRSLWKYKFGQVSLEQSKVWNFALWWAPFVQIIYSLSQKRTEELSLMTLESGGKFKEKLTYGFKYDMRNLVNFHPATQKTENFTLMGSFCPKYIRFELQKLRRSYLSWHWTMMQNLNKPWPCGFKNDMRNWLNFH